MYWCCCFFSAEQTAPTFLPRRRRCWWCFEAAFIEAWRYDFVEVKFTVHHESVNALQMKLRKLQMSITSWMPDELMMLMRVVTFQNILENNMSRPWFYIVWFFTLLHLVDCHRVVGKHTFCCLWRSKMRGEDSTISQSTPPSSLPECRAKHCEDKNYKENKRRR